MKNYFKIFSSKYWWLYVTLPLLLVVSCVIILLIFHTSLNDFSAWASLTAGILTYIGSSFLGIVVFYSTWVQQYKQEHVFYDLSLNITEEGKCLFEEKDVKKADIISTHFFGSLLPEKKLVYFSFTLQNLNHQYPLQYSVIQVEYGLKGTNKFFNCKEYYAKTTRDYVVPLGTNETVDFYIGLSKKEITALIPLRNIKFRLTLLLYNTMDSYEIIKYDVDSNCCTETKVLSFSKAKKILKLFNKSNMDSLDIKSLEA